MSEEPNFQINDSDLPDVSKRKSSKELNSINNKFYEFLKLECAFEGERRAIPLDTISEKLSGSPGWLVAVRNAMGSASL